MLEVEGVGAELDLVIDLGMLAAEASYYYSNQSLARILSKEAILVPLR